jgi:hypothetical protein
MMWNYIQLADETQLAYSDVRDDGTVLVVAERPVDSGFDSARCTLPAFTWSAVEGFSPSEMRELDAIVRDNAPFIFELAQRPLRQYA